MENKELSHHGILGMKWGVRRYQNPDGTLTAKGKKRYSAEMEKLKKEEAVLKNKQRTKAKVDKLMKKRQELDEMKRKISGKTEDDNVSKSAKTPTPNKPKSIKDMTDEELAARINRLRLEQTYKALTPEIPSAGEKFINKVLKPTGEKLANKLGDTILDKVNKEMRNKFGLDVDEKELKALKKEAETIGYKKNIAEAKAAIKKANGENPDTEYDKLRRESEIANFKKTIAISEKIQRENRESTAKTESVKVSDVSDEVKDAGEKYIQMNIFELLD